MTWEWGHAVEAYAAAQRNVQAKPKEWLEKVYAEWQALGSAEEFPGSFDQAAYTVALKEAAGLTDDVLADRIWENMESLRFCTNGGWDAWACPFGCGCHMVSFTEEV